MDPYELAQKLMSGELVVVVAKNPEPQKPKLTPDEQALADSLTSIAAKYGKFNEDETGIWAGYEAAKDNVVAHIGVKCSNCALYEGNGVCKIIAQKVEDGGKCRFAVIPDGVVKGVWSPETEKPSPRKKKGVKVKALGATIGGTTSPDDMIDRDGDGMILDGTPDEQPVKKKPKQAYEKLPNTFLERRRRRQVQRDLAAAGETPDQMPNRSDRERALRAESRDNFSVDEDRKRFVRNQLRKRGITPNARLENRTDDERQARREARAEYDRRMRAGEPRRQSPKIGEPTAPGMGPQQFPPGYVPGRPADRYPEPKPDTSFQDNEDRRNAAKRPVGRPVDRLPGAQPGYPRPSSPAKQQEEWDGIVRSGGMEWVSDRYPNRPGGANSPLRNDPKWIAEQIEKQRASKPPQRTGDSGGANAPRRRPGATEPNYRTMPRRGTDAPPTINNMPRRGSDAPPRIEPMTRRPGDPPLRARMPEPGSPPRRTTEPGMYGRPGDPPLRARMPEPGSPPPKTEIVPRREPRNAKERLITRIFED